MRSYNNLFSSMFSSAFVAVLMISLFSAASAFGQVCSGNVTVQGDNLGAPFPHPNATPCCYNEWPVVSEADIIGDGWVTDVNITIDVTHNVDGNLAMFLISPEGTEVNLVVNRGAGGDNFTVTTFDDEASVPIINGSPPYNGEFQPEEPLSNFDGESAGGLWTLEIEDDVSLASHGTLNDVQLNVVFADLDEDGDGSFVCDDVDCDDAEPLAFPGNLEVCDGVDNDCNGVVDSDNPNCTDDDGDSWTEDEGDCNDAEPLAFPGNLEVCDGVDNDCDAVVDEDIDVDGDGVPVCGLDGVPGNGDDDCDDTEAGVLPGAPEACDGMDSDCDGSTPSDENNIDGDGWMPCTGDCQDGDPTVFPGAPESCDSTDSDCDGDLVDGFSNNDVDSEPDCVDADDDNDGEPDITDCSELDDTIYNGAPEVSDDGVDQDCNGFDTVACFEDLDQDGFGSASIVLANDGLCDTDEQESGNSDDCDDSEVTVYPGNPEVCDGLDNDCDGSVPADESDDDGDGWMPCAGDCSDGDAVRYPGNTEVCDGVDNDCDLLLPGNEQDADVDGWMECEGDCNPSVATVFPGAAEVSDDGVDQDCSGADTVTCFVDADGDSFGASQTLLAADGDCTSAGRSESDSDCDDGDDTVYPGAVEVGSCDGLDTDCDGVIPPIEADSDGDGALGCTGDCADDDPLTYVDAPELCDGVDNDCDGSLPDLERRDEEGELLCNQQPHFFLGVREVGCSTGVAGTHAAPASVLMVLLLFIVTFRRRSS